MAYMKDKGIYEGSVKMERAKPDRAHAPKWMGPAFSKRDGSNTVIFQGAENIFVPMLHHEYSDTATIGNPTRSSEAQGHAVFERISDHLAAFLEEVKKFQGFEVPVSYTHLRAHETRHDLVCRLLLEKKKKKKK